MSDYLTAEQYEYARKTGDWESGKVLTHGQALNENQQIVLNYLIKQAERCSDIGYLAGDLNFFASTEDGKAWAGLTEKERYQVLAAFAEWGCKSNE